MSLKIKNQKCHNIPLKYASLIGYTEYLQGLGIMNAELRSKCHGGTKARRFSNWIIFKFSNSLIIKHIEKGIMNDKC